MKNLSGANGLAKWCLSSLRHVPSLLYGLEMRHKSSISAQLEEESLGGIVNCTVMQGLDIMYQLGLGNMRGSRSQGYWPWANAEYKPRKWRVC